MLLINNTKQVQVSKGTIKVHLNHYVIDDIGNILAIATKDDNNKKLYAYAKDIISIEDDRILVSSLKRRLPNGAKYCKKIYPSSKMYTPNSDLVGRVDTLDIDDLRIVQLISHGNAYNTSHIIAIERKKIIVNIASHSCNADEDISLDISPLIGRVARSTLYSHSGSIIIAKGETVTLTNVLLTIRDYSLIKFINNLL